MKATWAEPAADLDVPTRWEAFTTLRSSLWTLTRGGSRLVHRRTLDAHVQRQLLAQGRDASWLTPGTRPVLETQESAKAEYLEMVAAHDAASQRYSLARAGLIARWGPYVCVLPPRRLVYPGGVRGEASVILTLEPTDRVDKELASIGLRAAEDWGLVRVARGDAGKAYPLVQDWQQLLQWPRELPLGSYDAVREALASSLADGELGTSSVVEDAIPISASLMGSVHATVNGRSERLEKVLLRPPTLWGGLPIGLTSRALAGKLASHDDDTVRDVAIVVDHSKGLPRITARPIKPFYRSLVQNLLGATKLPSLAVAMTHAGETGLSGDIIRTAAGPLLTWFTLVSDSVLSPNRTVSQVRIPIELEPFSRMIISSYGTSEASL